MPSTNDPVVTRPPEELAAEYGAELHRYFSQRECGLISVRANGVTLLQRLGSDWKVLCRMKADVPLERWTAGKREVFMSQPAWAREVTEMPTMEEVEDWVHDSVCDTPTGHQVEPDGEGPDGVPSWLRLLGLI